MNRFYKIPNAIFNYDISSSAFTIYIIMTNRFYFTDKIKVKLATLSKLSGLSINTVRSALTELHNLRLIEVHNNFRNKMLSTSSYKLNRLTERYSVIDEKSFYFMLHTMDKSALMVYCAIRYFCNGSDKAFPSYKQISRLTGFTKSTCIAKVKLLTDNCMLTRSHYICSAGDFGHNNYTSITTRLRFFLFKFLLAFCKISDIKNHPKKPFLRKMGGIIFDKHIKASHKNLKIEITNRFSFINKLCSNIYKGISFFKKSLKRLLI